MIITRATAGASHKTFQIKPIRALLERYVTDPTDWVDPFAGNSTLAGFRNDHNPETSAQWHLDSEEFCNKVAGPFDGVLFDPPYSYRQISEHYRVIGRRATALDTSSNFYNRVMNAIADKVQIGGHAISFGWNTNGFGRNRGYEIVEILIVAHANGHHNDTLVTVEKHIDFRGRKNV